MVDSSPSVSTRSMRIWAWSDHRSWWKRNRCCCTIWSNAYRKTKRYKRMHRQRLFTLAGNPWWSAGCEQISTTERMPSETPVTKRATPSFRIHPTIDECCSIYHPSIAPSSTSLSNCPLSFAGLWTSPWHALRIQIKGNRWCVKSFRLFFKGKTFYRFYRRSTYQFNPSSSNIPHTTSIGHLRKLPRRQIIAGNTSGIQVSSSV